ncbi:MAG: hypothetical protein Q8R36_02380 [bacterium]|nr:hypothetical protein [bacterium]
MEKNIIRHIWTVLCKNTLTDKDSNNLSINNVVEQINISKKQNIPTTTKERLENLRIPIQLELITLWSREDSEGRGVDARMQLLDPQGKVLINQQYQLAFEKLKKRLRFRMRMDGIIISISGEYLFVISTKEDGAKNYKDRIQIPVDVKITE